MDRPSSTFGHIDKVFRQSYGAIVASHLDRFGLDKVEMVENAVMESFYKALKVWPLKNVPDNPRGWLYRASLNHLLDQLRKQKNASQYFETLVPANTEAPVLPDEKEISDPELQLLFLICHPELQPRDQLAFMLKILSGFGIREIAGALLQNEEVIKKRLQRARKFIRSRDLKFNWPAPEEIVHRRVMVHKALYLLFNEGYYSSGPDHWVRKDFCLESMRLCKFLCDHSLGNYDSNALMSLMCYHISRFPGRMDLSDNFILLKNQDRTKWDPYFIRIGHHYLEKSASMTEDKTEYQIEAFISAQHCLAESIEKTNWPMLEVLYSSLYRLKKTNLVFINLIIVKMQGGKLLEAKQDYENLDSAQFGRYKSTYFLVGAELYRQLSDSFRSRLLLEQAVQNASTQRESLLIQSQFDENQNKN